VANPYLEVERDRIVDAAAESAKTGLVLVAQARTDKPAWADSHVVLAGGSRLVVRDWCHYGDWCRARCRVLSRRRLLVGRSGSLRE
jgi:hypothetical protein